MSPEQNLINICRNALLDLDCGRETLADTATEIVGAAGALLAQSTKPAESTLMDSLTLFQHLAGAEAAISDGRLATALAHVAGAKEQAIAETADSLCQGGDSRWVLKATGEIVETGTLQFYDQQRQGLVEQHLGHLFTATWEEAAWSLVEHGGYEWVDHAKDFRKC